MPESSRIKRGIIPLGTTLSSVCHNQPVAGKRDQRETGDRSTDRCLMDYMMNWGFDTFPALTQRGNQNERTPANN